MPRRQIAYPLRESQALSGPEDRLVTRRPSVYPYEAPTRPRRSEMSDPTPSVSDTRWLLPISIEETR